MREVVIELAQQCIAILLRAAIPLERVSHLQGVIRQVRVSRALEFPLRPTHEKHPEWSALTFRQTDEIPALTVGVFGL
jgi:hypothetical protein